MSRVTGPRLLKSITHSVRGLHSTSAASNPAALYTEARHGASITHSHADLESECRKHRRPAIGNKSDVRVRPLPSFAPPFHSPIYALVSPSDIGPRLHQNPLTLQLIETPVIYNHLQNRTLMTGTP